MRPQSPDTSTEVDALMFRLYREMGPAGRLRRAVELSDTAWSLALVGLRQRYPDQTEDQLRARLIAMRLGEELAAEVQGHIEADG